MSASRLKQADCPRMLQAMCATKQKLVKEEPLAAARLAWPSRSCTRIVAASSSADRSSTCTIRAAARAAAASVSQAAREASPCKSATFAVRSSMRHSCQGQGARKGTALGRTRARHSAP